MKFTVSKVSRLSGRPVIPGDKSISHRALLFSGMARGKSEVTGLSDGEDVRSTQKCLQGLGIRIERDGHRAVIHGQGLRGFVPPRDPLDCGNSGTTMRTLMGALAGQSFTTTLIGDESLSRRPMARVAEPLRQMGARIEMRDGTYAPLTLNGSQLRGASIELEVASAQVKSAILLAGLYAEGRTTVRGLITSRDHTERMLPHFGARIDVSGEAITIEGGQELRGATVAVPADPSSAAFWLAAACVVPGGRVEIDNLLLNPTRAGFFEVLKRMGASITEDLRSRSPEPVGRLEARGGRLAATTIRPVEVPSLVDEIPLVAVLGAYAHGRTEVRGAEELRVKETDRIEAVAENLRRMGAHIETFPDGFCIEGPQKLRGAPLDSFGDHRIAMAFTIAALQAEGETVIARSEAVDISYPTFFATLKELVNA